MIRTRDESKIGSSTKTRNTRSGFKSTNDSGQTTESVKVTGKRNITMARPIFSKSKYPYVSDCQQLDAQISGLRNEKDLVYRGQMQGSKKEVNDLLLAKELQFNQQKCSIRLEDEVVYGVADMTQEEFKKNEKAIIGESNKKRQVMLIGGGVVLLIGLAIFIK